jgi:phenylalanyl-tRNA synthetase beta chain
VFEARGESTRIGWVLTGLRGSHWSGGGGPMDLFDAKGIAELLVQASLDPADVETVADDSLPWFAPGRSARIISSKGGANDWLGHVGQVRAEILTARGLDTGVVVGGEIDLSALLRRAATGDLPLRAIPRHPSVVRDLSIVVPERLPAAEVRGTIRSNAPTTLAAIGEFDRYTGKGVPEGHVSLSIRLTFRHADRTLTDGEVQQAVDAIVASLATRHGAILRGKG